MVLIDVGLWFCLGDCAVSCTSFEHPTASFVADACGASWFQFLPFGLFCWLFSWFWLWQYHSPCVLMLRSLICYLPELEVGTPVIRCVWDLAVFHILIISWSMHLLKYSQSNYIWSVVHSKLPFSAEGTDPILLTTIWLHSVSRNETADLTVT